MGRKRNESGEYTDRVEPDSVLEAFDERTDHAEPLTARDVAEETGIARRTAHNKLALLVERGTLETKKVGARGRVYWIPQEGPSAPVERSEPTDDLSPSESTTPVLDDVLGRWEPDTQADGESARGQTRRTVEFLRDHAPDRFKAGELKDELADESSFSPRHWWERAVQPGLRYLSDCDLVEYRAGHHDYRWVGGTDQ